MKERSSSAPIVTLLLIAALIYFGSYFALVLPEGVLKDPRGDYYFSHYRYGDFIAPRVFWPLEQIDRRLRPARWERLHLYK